MVFLGMLHSLNQWLAKDIRLIQPAPPLLSLPETLP